MEINISLKIVNQIFHVSFQIIHTQGIMHPKTMPVYFRKEKKIQKHLTIKCNRRVFKRYKNSMG